VGCEVKLGLVTIGQSPRDDVMPSMFPCMDHSDILQAGALDGMSAEQIAGLAPGGGEHPLVTRLRSGAEVVISKERVTPSMQRAVEDVAESGASLICILCTGEFNLLHQSSRLVYPDRLLKGVVDAVAPGGRLGVLMPHAGQASWMQEKWASNRRQVQLEVFSPYQSIDDLTSAGQSLKRAGSEMIVMDCMGYTVEMQGIMMDASEVPVVLANSMTGAILSSMVSQD
jgi:protein AroM